MYMYIYIYLFCTNAHINKNPRNAVEGKREGGV